MNAADPWRGAAGVEETFDSFIALDKLEKRWLGRGQQLSSLSV